MVVPDGGVIRVSDFARSLSVEPEIAFVMGEDLNGPGVVVPEVLKAVDGVVPAIEVPTSRMKGDFEIQDAIADNASSGRVVFSGRKVGIDEVDLRYVGMVLEVRGKISATAAGAAVLGNPVHSLCWLANKLSEYGLGLRAGETIISGSLVAPWTVRAGDSVKVTFDRLGSVSVRFTK
jgi:2-keto-4-pentenoate hydratase